MPIATPEVYAEMLGRAKEHSFAFPAVNCVGSESINAALKGFADAGSDGIIQFSTGGAEFGSGLGVKDMVGLVWEWTLDFDAFAITPESRDPNGKEGGDFCGGAAAGVADPMDYPALMRYAMRASLKANYTADNLGFRCAGEAP